MNFRHWLNTNFLGRPDTPLAPISADDMATLTAIEAVNGYTSIPNEAGQHSTSCGPMCTKPTVEPNLEGIQYAVNLEVLDISYIGQMPELSSFPKLHTLDFHGNQITDYSWLSGEHFPALTTLTLRSQKLSQNLGPEFSTLENLTSLLLMSTPMTELPAAVTELPNLKKLKISWSKMTTLPDSIGNLTSLEELDLSGYPVRRSSITSLPESLGNLSNLRVLNLAYLGYLTDLPGSLSGLPALEVADLSGVDVTDKHPVVKAWLDRGVEVRFDLPY